MSTVVIKRAGEPIAPAVNDSRRISWVLATGTVDRVGDRILSWDTAQFRRNPTLLWAHDSAQPPIGRVADIRSTAGRLVGEIEFMPPDISRFADQIYRLTLAGFIRAASVGFRPLVQPIRSNDPSRHGGLDYPLVELLEVSVVSVPADPGALVAASMSRVCPRPKPMPHRAAPLSRAERVAAAKKISREVREVILSPAARDLARRMGADRW